MLRCRLRSMCTSDTALTRPTWANHSSGAHNPRRVMSSTFISTLLFSLLGECRITVINIMCVTSLSSTCMSHHSHQHYVCHITLINIVCVTSLSSTLCVSHHSHQHYVCHITLINIMCVTSLSSTLRVPHHSHQHYVCYITLINIMCVTSLSST